MGFSKLMVGTDFSEQADNTLNLAALYAKELSAELDVVHVSNNFEENALPIMMDTELSSGKTFKEFILESLQSVIDAQIAKNKELKGIKVQEHLYLGNPKNELKKHIEKEKPALLFVGFHGHNFLSDVIMGSVTEKMLKVSPTSVFVVKESESKKPKNISVMVDFSETTEKTIEFASELAKAFCAKLTLNHLVEADPEVYYSLSEVDGFSGVKTIQDLLDREKSLADEKMNKLVSKVKASGIDVTGDVTIAKDFQTSDNLNKMADKNNADLVVLSPHSKSWFQNFIFGSTAQRIVETSKKNIVVVKSSEDKK